MGVLLGQLPPAEVARLKAELAETLIANFCYPRFFDHRTDLLRMRPVDRSKRQEVWLYLSSVDFTSWGRVDLMSPDLQRQIERLFIQFVQRNRSFFGEQGRKRMSDLRMLIGTCASSVAEGLRGHLTGRRPQGLPFGSPRPVVSWSSLVVNGKVEPNWERIAPATLLLQQQLQEWRGEIKPTSASSPNNGHAASASHLSQEVIAEVKPVPVESASDEQSPRPIVRRPHREAAPAPVTSPRNAPNRGPGVRPVPVSPMPPVQSMLVNGASMPQPPVDIRSVPPTPTNAPPLLPQQQPQAFAHSTTTAPIPGPTHTNPLESTWTAVPPVSVPVAPSLAQRKSAPAPVETITPNPAHMAPAPASAQQRVLAPISGAEVAAQPREGTGVLTGGEDIAIFEQMRHQLVVWLRIEAVHAGIDISGQGPVQLLELLRQRESIDETRLQVVSTLLGLVSQVMKNGQASLLDYKQALMFHLLHTRDRH